MQYIVADLEWNGSYSKKAHGYFNEIIEIGAVKLNEQMEEVDTFHAVIKPVVSRKLTDLVSDLTNITAEELEEGTSFPAAASALRRWVGKEPSVLLTWSNTDLSVLLENYRYFLHTDRIPFMHQYADLQAYVQSHEKLGGPGQQVGLAKACEALGISDEGFDQHRALDDSRMTAAIAQKTFDAAAFPAFVRQADDAFYDRLNFKAYYIRDIDSPLIARHHLRFRCPSCGRTLRRRGEWRSYNNAFWSEMVCRPCDKSYTARAQFRKKYDSLEVKRKLTERESENKKEEQNNG
ncbi:MAG: exonuclease domain-containing protein [Clostridia bacterium]|nr:exonuclease domain-containing protein [Clostridia bacterium]